MKYLIIGAGGTGGLIGGYLAKKHHDVTLVARSEHLKAIQNKGLTIKTYGEAPVCIKNIKAISEQQMGDQKFDVIFVCVKAYDLKNIIPMLKRTSHLQSIIIPILNSLGAGHYLRTELPGLNIYDGCIYITGYISAPGEVSQNNRIFKIFYGLNEVALKPNLLIEKMQKDFLESEIDIRYSSLVTNEIFRKLTFTSAFAACAAYHNKKAIDLQKDGPYRQLFVDLLHELKQISDRAGFGLTENFFEDNLRILDSLSADFTASLQKDLKQKKPDERNELIFDIVRLAGKHHLQLPYYSKIAEHFDNILR
ncbi:ketopantoate reductase family protein [Mucilaginibacter endophyticus]|uniref:ketopantoate reductase family protein n=1 Tax=Mucilaginibacter endophyticus TaxID=2675003 RepID=UPI000E0E0645|nr:2-dehydropantoate 2-reductase [Mucilaginibacter endophyticus]